MREKKSSLAKALEILLLFDETKSELGITEISNYLKIPPSTVYRLVSTLAKMRFLSQDKNTKKYKLGTIFLKLANIMKSNLKLINISYPYMKELSRLTQETTHLNIIDGYERVCIESIESNQPLMARMTVGSRSPLYAGASSKCLLAFSSDEFISEYLNKVTLIPITQNTITDKDKLLKELYEIRKKGYAISLSERNHHLGAVSAPVFGYNRTLIAALSIAVPEIRFKDKVLREKYIKDTVSVASKLSSAFGYDS